jgi:hypothetical protein
MGILAAMSCQTSRQLELAARAAGNEANRRHGERKTYLDDADARWDDDNMAFLEQAVVEAEIRTTEARYALDEHLTECPLCAHYSRN